MSLSWRRFDVRSMSLTQLGITVVVILALVTGSLLVASFLQSPGKTASHSAKPTSVPSPTQITLTDTPEPTEEQIKSSSKSNYIQNGPVGPAKIDCVGPDGKHFKATQQDCDTFNKAWATPTPTPSPTSAVTNTPAPTSLPDVSPQSQPE